MEGYYTFNRSLSKGIRYYLIRISTDESETGNSGRK